MKIKNTGVLVKLVPPHCCDNCYFEGLEGDALLFIHENGNEYSACDYCEDGMYFEKIID